MRSAATKILPLSRLKRAVLRAQAAGRKVVFTNGCFDLLHAGHIHLLQQARWLGDLLVVGVNSDRSLKSLKGSGRPVVREKQRVFLLGALEAVDYVTVFREPTPLKLIEALKPDVLVKGADWKESAIVGRKTIERRGGRVVRISLVPGYSTTKLIEHIRSGKVRWPAKVVSDRF